MGSYAALFRNFGGRRRSVIEVINFCRKFASKSFYEVSKSYSTKGFLSFFFFFFFFLFCRNGSLDILIADTPILDYYRATDHGCKLQKVGDTINEDTYAIGMMKGFPLKVSLVNFFCLLAILSSNFHFGSPGN